MPIVDDIAGLRRILTQHRTIAVVGLSAQWHRPSYFAAKYMQDHGYRIIPVNPNYDEVLGEKSYPALTEVTEPVGIVDCFRKASEMAPIARDAVAIGAKVLWMQLGIRNDEAARIATDAGLDVVMNRCVKIEYARIMGGLNWAGVNTGVVSARPRRLTQHRQTASTVSIRCAFTPGTSRTPRPGSSCAAHLSDDVFRVRQRRSRREPLQPADVRQRLFAHFEPDRRRRSRNALRPRGRRAALAAATGMAAQMVALLTLAQNGDHIVAARTLYGGTYSQLAVTFAQFGIDATFVDPDEPDAFRRALRPETKAIYAETIGNPQLNVLDIDAVASVARDAGVPLVIDNTLASPFLCRPIEHGADIVIHSATKYLGGHGTTMGGVIVESGKFDWGNGRFPQMTMPSRGYHGVIFHETFGDFGFTMKARMETMRTLGPTLAPFSAFMLLQGIETLHLRMPRHCESALAVARHLSAHPRVEWVGYPSLAGNLAKPWPGAIFRAARAAS